MYCSLVNVHFILHIQLSVQNPDDFFCQLHQQFTASCTVIFSPLQMTDATVKRVAHTLHLLNVFLIIYV